MPQFRQATYLGGTTEVRRTRREKVAAKTANGDLGFETTLWQAADKLRGNLDSAEYKHVVLGLIFLKYISDAFRVNPLPTSSRQRRGRSWNSSR